MHVEFVIVGTPISNQSAGSPALALWRAAVTAEAKKAWTGTPLADHLKAVIINFYDEEPLLDLDNMSKPILDVMQGVVYENDRQVRQLELSHLWIETPLVFVKTSKLITDSVRVGLGFVYVRIEAPVEPYPLPR